MRAIRRLRLPLLAALVLFVFSACSTIPEETEKARGVLSGMNLVLALSVLVFVVAVGAILAVLAVDRTIRNRRALAERGPVEEEPDEDEVVAGISVGRAAVPRWLYGAYVLIPLFAFAYVFSNIAPAPVAEGPAATEAPTGPCTECTIEAAQIEFDLDVLEVAAEQEIVVTLNNEDTGVPHDFTVWESEEPGSGEQVSTTGNIGGGATGEAEFTAPAEGTTWSYNCTIHPASMVGTIEPVAG